MTETNTATIGVFSKPVTIVGATLTAGLLAAMGYAAINLPGALSSPAASAPAAPPNGVYAEPAPANDEILDDSTIEEDPSEEAEADVLDESDEDSEHESDDHPDRDSDRNGDTWLRETEADFLTSDVVYTVRSGDTLASISDEVGISVDMLAEYNDIRDTHLIYRDSSLVIPYSEVSIEAD